MKILFIICLIAFSYTCIFAQNTSSIVTVILTGNLNKQVYVDGVNYQLSTYLSPGNSNANNPANNNANASIANTAIIPNVTAGQHSLQVVNINQPVIRNNRNTKIFNTRAGYDLKINVNGNGSIVITETRNSKR